MTDPTLLDAYRYRKVGPVELHLGDARQVLTAMPDASVDSIVTSPPFWSLRDYGTGTWRGGNPACPHPLRADRRIGGASCGRCGATWVDPQYGLEPTVEEYVDRPRAGAGNLVPLGHAHTAAHPCGRNPGDVWRIATRPYRGSHVAPIPIDLPLRAIAAGCQPGGRVLDPFSGAATTALAALQLGHRYVGIDISAAFHDEALIRLAPHLPEKTLGEDGG
ncbi:DNA methyltransferase [Salinispora pacifica]|uniref:DNA methyltransferase n=1 Tax=Salinispora pacifica TaxID=351187 RepID=UPI0004ADE4BC|nr:DNA methyltransferase [Salinispora pacifica]